MTTWIYDNAGNLTNDGTAHTYDALNRMTARGTTSYAYTGDGVLVAETTGGTTTRYTQDLAAPLSQVLQTRVGAGAWTSYLYGHERLASLASPRAWYLTDALGTVRRTVSDAGAIQGTASYSAWGVPQGSLIAPFGFTGELQSGAGLTYLRARWYNASSGRFGSRDPFAGFSEQPYSLHSYQYGYANPVLYTDPSGRCVAYGNQECALVRTWSELEDLFPAKTFGLETYPRSPAESARLPQWKIPYPRQVAEWAAALDVVRSDPRYAGGTYPIASDLFGQAEMFATYFLGFSILDADSPYISGLQTELDCLDAKLHDNQATVDEVIRRTGILGAMGLIWGHDAYQAPDTGGGGGGGGGGGTITVYRAVSEAEFQDLQAGRTFRMHSSSAEGKYFAERPEHAAKWGDLMEGPGNYHIVSGEVLLDVPAYRWEKLDGIGPARFYEADQLSQIRYTGGIR